MIKTRRVVSDRKQQQKRDGRMFRTEDDASRQVAERDVGGRRDCPAAFEVGPVEDDGQRYENQRRPEHSSDCGGQRHGRATR